MVMVLQCAGKGGDYPSCSQIDPPELIVFTTRFLKFLNATFFCYISVHFGVVTVRTRHSLRQMADNRTASILLIQFEDRIVRVVSPLDTKPTLPATQRATPPRIPSRGFGFPSSFWPRENGIYGKPPCKLGQTIVWGEARHGGICLSEPDPNSALPPGDVVFDFQFSRVSCVLVLRSQKIEFINIFFSNFEQYLHFCGKTFIWGERVIDRYSPD